MKALLLLVMLNLMSLSSQAMSPFEQHLQAVAQGVSAFYMYELSKGDDKFLQEFKRFNSVATQSLETDKLDLNIQLLKRWKALTPKLKFSVDESGLTFIGSVRQEYRVYLVDLFLRYQEQVLPENKMIPVFERVQLFNALLSARALDVASSLWGARTFTEHVRLFDQKKVALQVEIDLETLMKADLAPSQMSTLRKVSSKFQFMKQSLVDYQAKAAFFLMYRNVMSINKLMANGQVM